MAENILNEETIKWINKYKEEFYEEDSEVTNNEVIQDAIKSVFYLNLNT